MSCLSRRTGPLMWDSEFNYLTSRGPQYPVGLVKTYAQDRRSEDKVRLRRCFVQSNYSGSWTEPVCVLHRICGHETEDDKKKIIDSARLFNSSVIISEWNTQKKFLSFQRMWKSVFSRRWLLQYFLDWTKHLVYHVQCIQGKKNNKMHLHKILILKFLMLSFVPI